MRQVSIKPRLKTVSEGLSVKWVPTGAQW